MDLNIFLLSFIILVQHEACAQMRCNETCDALGVLIERRGNTVSGCTVNSLCTGIVCSIGLSSTTADTSLTFTQCSSPNSAIFQIETFEGGVDTTRTLESTDDISGSITSSDRLDMHVGQIRGGIEFGASVTSSSGTNQLFENTNIPLSCQCSTGMVETGSCIKTQAMASFVLAAVFMSTILSNKL